MPHFGFCIFLKSLQPVAILLVSLTQHGAHAKLRLEAAQSGL